MDGKSHLGVAEVADLQSRRRTAVEQGVLQFEIPVTNLLRLASISLTIFQKDYVFLMRMQ